MNVNLIILLAYMSDLIRAGRSVILLLDKSIKHPKSQ